MALSKLELSVIFELVSKAYDDISLATSNNLAGPISPTNEAGLHLSNCDLDYSVHQIISNRNKLLGNFDVLKQLLQVKLGSPSRSYDDTTILKGQLMHGLRKSAYLPFISSLFHVGKYRSIATLNEDDNQHHQQDKRTSRTISILPSMMSNLHFKTTNTATVRTNKLAVFNSKHFHKEKVAVVNADTTDPLTHENNNIATNISMPAAPIMRRNSSVNEIKRNNFPTFHLFKTNPSRQHDDNCVIS